ncbi:hypothetical protein BH09ACT12_BH09ACT12_19410 [soil metagenome]
MEVWVRVRLPALVAVLGVGAVAASVSAPDAGFVAGIWPVGLATGMMVIAPRRQAPFLFAVTFVVAVASVAAFAQPFVVAVGYGVGVTLEVALAALVLGYRGDGSRGGSLRSDDDLRRWLAACIGSAFVGGAAMTLTAMITDVGRPVLTGVGVWIAHMASQMLVTPFFLRAPEHGAVARNGERLTQWCVIVVSTPFLLLPTAAPGLIFLTIPILVWGALRITPWESMGQLSGVVTFAVVLSALGRGPFPSDPQIFGVPVEIRGVLLSGFAVTCAVIVVPSMLRVGEYLGATRAAEAERDLVTNIVDSATGVAIIVTDGVGRIVRFNPGAERSLGYRADEVIGKFTPFLHTDDAIAEKTAELGVAPDYVSMALAMIDEPEGTLVRFRRKDGVERTHSTTVTLLADSKGRPTGYLCTSEDITDAVVVQAALRAALTAEQEAVERLREIDLVKDSFVSTVSHELRTPITSILGYLELLSDGSLGGLDHRQLDALVRVSSNSHRLLGLIDDLLTLSQVAEHGVQATYATFDLREAVNEGCAVVAPTCAHPRRLGLALDLPDTELHVDGDRDMLERVVVNLLSNAVKFTRDGGSIRVELERHASEAVLLVRDTGIGIPESEQAGLFTRFFRSSLSQGQAIQGSGLGLSIARGIVDRHGGSIGVRSMPGEGTTVEVRLPLAGNVQDSTNVEFVEQTG